MKAFFYYITRAFIWLISLLPNRLLYALSDLLYLILYYIVRYRRALVRRNLSESFPEKKAAEIIEIEKKFYKHLSDVFVEYIILSRANTQKIHSMVNFVNPELVDDLMSQNKNVVIVAAHYGNWELACCIGDIFKTVNETIAVYKRLHNKYWDKWFNNLRSKFGATLIEMRQIYFHLARNKARNVKSATVLIADQLPKIDETKYCINFLNHEGTIIYLGPEILAKKLDMAVVYGDMTKVKRGCYEVKFVPIVLDAKSSTAHEITDLQIKYLENKIRRAPEFWMWSHNRWKRTRKTIDEK